MMDFVARPGDQRLNVEHSVSGSVGGLNASEGE
jgi:hypothetical protein